MKWMDGITDMYKCTRRPFHHFVVRLILCFWGGGGGAAFLHIPNKNSPIIRPVIAASDAV